MCGYSNEHFSTRRFEMDALVLGAGIYIGGGVVVLILIILILIFLFR